MNAGQLRVGHREREATIEALRFAASEGRLSPTELDERTRAAQAAVTYADLGSLVADLPPTSATAGSRQAFRPGMPGSTPDRRLAFSGGMSSHTQQGVWQVAPFLSVSPGMGSVKLDFELAICPFDVVDIYVIGGVGSATLVVPEGWGANIEGMRKGMGSVRSKVDAIPAAGKPVLLLHGQAAVGSVTVRGPRRSERRRAARVLASRPDLAGRSLTGPEAQPSPPASPAAPLPRQDDGPAGPQDASVQEWRSQQG